MLAVIDYRTNEQAVKNLREYTDDIYLFRTDRITYNSISGHPDIFIYQNKKDLIIAPNSPSSLFDFLNKHNIKFMVGEKTAGNTLKESTHYNCMATEKYFFHKKGFTEETILEANMNKKFINLPQAYTRCGLIHLLEDVFVTSDKGVEKELHKNNLKCFYFDPSEIKIFDHKHGFIGGTAGVIENKIFFNGNLDLHKDGEGLRNFINGLGIEIICLGNHKLYDGGGIFFINNVS